MYASLHTYVGILLVVNNMKKLFIFDKYQHYVL